MGWDGDGYGHGLISTHPSPHRTRMHEDTNARTNERPQRMDNQSHRSTIYISLSPFCLLLFSLTYTPNQPKQPCTNLYVAFSQVSHLSIYLLSFLPIRISSPTVFPVPLGFRLRAYTHRVHICLLALCTYVPCCIRSVNSSVLFYDLSCLTIYFSFTLSWTLSIYQQESLYICITIFPV